MRYTIEGFSQIEAVKFRRVEIVNGKERTVTLDCTDLVILRWFVDFWPRMTKVEVDGRQYAWVSYKCLIEDMPLLGIKKRALALRLMKLADFGILSHHTVKSGGTFSYYGFGSEYTRLIDDKPTSTDCNPSQLIDEGVANQLTTPSQFVDEGVVKRLTTPSQLIDVQNNSSTKNSVARDSSAKYSSTKGERVAKPKSRRFEPPTLDEAKAYASEMGYPIDVDHFIDYYTANGWVQGRGKPIKDWKAALRNWAKNDRNFHPDKEDKGDYSKYDDFMFGKGSQAN